MPEVIFSADLDPVTRVLSVAGDLDEPWAGRLRDAIEEHTGSYVSALTVDLSGVDYLPSVAVGVLATARQRLAAAGASLDLVAESGSVAQRVLAVCALPHRTS